MREVLGLVMIVPETISNSCQGFCFFDTFDRAGGNRPVEIGQDAVAVGVYGLGQLDEFRDGGALAEESQESSCERACSFESQSQTSLSSSLR